jgi:hypothetical protein
MGKTKSKSTKRAATFSSRVPNRNTRVDDIQELSDRITRLEESLPRNHPLHPDSGGGRSPLKHPEDVAVETEESKPRPPRAPRVTKGQRARQRK